MALNTDQQNQLVSALQSKGGYSETDARNAAANSGGRADDLFREFIGASSGGGGGDAGVSQAMQELRKAVEVSTGAIKGQQDLLPQQTNQRKTELVQQQTNLEKRYEALIGEIQGQTQQAIDRTTGTTREELASRGINVQGNLASQEVNKVLNPINQTAAGQIQQVGLSREADLQTIMNAINNLPIQEKQQWLALQQAIGNAQASGSQTQLQAALQLAQQQQAQMEAQRQYELQLQQAEQQAQMFPLQLQQLQADINKTNKGTGSGSSDGNIANDWYSLDTGSGNASKNEKAVTTYSPTSPYDFGVIDRDTLNYLTFK